MQVRAVIYHPAVFTEELYQQGLLLVDDQSAARIKRFYRREDACRTLIGRLLARMLLKENGIPSTRMRFGTTEAGKPYFMTPELDPPIGFNITHDNALVAIAFAPGRQLGPEFGIGIDIMKVRVPGRDTFASFVNTVGDQLTLLERSLLFSGVTEEEGLRRFFWMWTLKEAYTKALGIGLGFDFERVEFDVVGKCVRVDGKIPDGWRFNMFVLNDGMDIYQGVVAEFLGGEETEIVDMSTPQDWLIKYSAVDFVQRAIAQLTGE